MDITTRDRSGLKKYFVKNSIPTEENFAELIDGMLNQKDDGLVKLPGNPLSIEAAGDNTSQKKAINFYYSFADDNPSWSLSLNPRSDPSKADTARRGLSISDGVGNSRLFIDQATGNLGVGTIAPQATLEVSGSVKATSNVSGERSLRMEAPSAGNHRGDSGKQAATGLVYRVETNPGTGDPIFQVRSSGQAVRFFVEHDGWTGSKDNAAWFGGSQSNYFAGSVGIGTTDPGGSKLKIANSAADFADFQFADRGTGQLEIVGWSSGWNINAKTDGKNLYLNRDSGTQSNVLIGRNGNELFVRGSDGNVGIGATGSAAKVDIAAANRTGTHPTGAPLYVTGTYQPDSGGIEFRHSNGTQGIGFGYNTIYATGSNTNQDLNLKPRGTGNVSIGSGVRVNGFVAAQQVFFSAYLDSNARSNSLNPLPMQVTSQNIGNAYNTSASQFTAPVKGVYLFTMSGYRAEGSGSLNWFLMVNGNYANRAGTSSEESSERCVLSWSTTGPASRTIIVALNAGDEVHVQQTGTGRCDNYRSGLEGVLLYATL